MRVLLTADTAGGVWTYSVDLGRGLQRRDVRVTIAATGPREPDAPHALDVRWRPYALEWMADPWDDLEAANEWLLELCDELQPDIVHLNGFAPASLAWRTPVLVTAHSDVVTWWRAVRAEDPPQEWGRYRELVQEALHAADAVVFPTRAHRAAVANAYDLADVVSRVVWNGLSALAPAGKEPYVAAAGRAWDEGKNLAVLSRIASRVPWPVRIADGTLPVSELRPLVAGAAVFAAPGLYEPFGLAALEAAGAGCALVLGDLPTQRELWEGAALFVDGRNDDAVATALTRLAHDAALRDQLAAAARRRSQLYTVDAMADSYLDVYRRLSQRVAA